MSAPTISFDDSAGYERLMGRWSRAVGRIFLDWVSPPQGARWLEIGCGTGVFTELALEKCSPSALSAIDPAQTQIDHAKQRSATRHADFQVADAIAIPFPNASFDVIVSALVINFISDRPRALAEMRRVARPGAMVAGYVWDFAEELSPSGLFRRGLRRFGVPVPDLPGASDSSIAALTKLFETAGFDTITTTAIEVALPYTDFDDFWQAQTSNFSPTTKAINAMSDGERAALIAALSAALPRNPDGGITYSARANAIRALVPDAPCREALRGAA